MDTVVRYLYFSNMNTRDANLILNYNLFGESGDLPDVVHCETIEVRSLLHDWEFAAHRHAGLHQFLLVENGGGDASLDGQTLKLQPMSLLNVPAGHVHGYSFIPGTEGLVVTLAAEMLDVAIQPAEGLREVIGRPAVLIANASCVRTMKDISETYGRRDFARAQILRSLSGLLLGHIARLMAAGDGITTTSARPEILGHFETLIDEYYTRHWGIAEYSRSLAVSPTHLSRITRSATGRSAGKLIAERIVREARRYLVYTNLPVSSIAYALGYQDPAYFSRFFSRETGLSPRAFRDRALRDEDQA
jgi:AraC family transcriptional activator of pobA